MRWAIVIGIDEYGDDEMRLSAAVADARRFRDWVVASSGGGVPTANVRLLLGRRPDDRAHDDGELEATKDSIVTAIHDVASRAEPAERLYFYFAGHGITARVASRDESALVTPGFDDLHTDHSLAIRSLTEHFETTPFEDQFFFIDACRNVPWSDREFQIGQWPVPRRRDPGAPPVQQFILYATSPGRTAAEVGWPGEAQGAFSSVLMEGLAGREQAKAWSWERNCYEVRWDRLAAYVNVRMTEQSPRPASVPPERWAVQIPQDSGSRGVAGRDRDQVVVAYPSGHFPNLALTLTLAADAEFDHAEVSVLDAIGDPVASAMKVTGASQRFTLPPRTYAVRAMTAEPGRLVGTVKAPVDLYEDTTVPITLTSPGAQSERLEPEDVAAAGREAPPGSIAIRSSDPLGVAEIRDEAGQVAAVVRASHKHDVAPGFYRVRPVGPEEPGDAKFVLLPAGRSRRVTLRAPAPPAPVAALAQALGGTVERGVVHPVDAAEPVAWAQPATIVAAGVGAALHGRRLPGLGIEDLPGAVGDTGSGVALLVVAADGDAARVRGVSARLWPAGEPVPAEVRRLEPSGAGVAALVGPAPEPTRYWISIERDGDKAVVVSLPVLPGRLATLVLQLDAMQPRLYQFHPAVAADASATPDRLRRLEYLQRLLLAGRLDGADALAQELAEAGAEDPFAGLLAGYVLLRLGRQDALDTLLGTLSGVAPAISDGHILRGEHVASERGAEAAAQAFVDAVNAGIPIFAEGLTRLVEGLRAGAFVHPRGALVRHLFQRHARGSMWTAFTPVRALEPGRLVVSGADLGFEG